MFKWGEWNRCHKDWESDSTGKPKRMAGLIQELCPFEACDQSGIYFLPQQCTVLVLHRMLGVLTTSCCTDKETKQQSEMLCPCLHRKGGNPNSWVSWLFLPPWPPALRCGSSGLPKPAGFRQHQSTEQRERKSSEIPSTCLLPTAQ